MRCCLPLLPLAGCAQVFGLGDPQRFDDAAPPDTELPPMIDATIDAAPRTCIEKWLDGPTFSTPQTVAPAATTDAEWDPSVTRDGLQFFFGRGNDIWVATRNSPTGPWGTASPSQFNSGSVETKVTISNDQLRAYVSSSRAPGSGGVDVWRYRRDLVTDPWVAQQAFLANVNTSGDEHDPHLSLDTLRLYLAVSINVQSVAVATRPDTMTGFDAPVVIAAIDASGVEGDPTLTDDERVLVYTAATSGLAVRRLMYATRTATNGTFSSGTELTQLNALVGYGDSDPHISADGCTLYFRSTRTGSGDIYMTTVQL